MAGHSGETQIVAMAEHRLKRWRRASDHASTVGQRGIRFSQYQRPRDIDRSASRIEALEKDIGGTGVDGDRDRSRASRDTVRERGQSRDADGWALCHHRKAPSGGEADAKTGEAARTNGHRDAVEFVPSAGAISHHAFDQRHEVFGLAAGAGKYGPRARVAVLPKRGGAGIECRV